jgi:hypothetical protein
VVVDGENVRRSTWPNLEQEELLARARDWAARHDVDLLLVFDGPAPEEAPDVAGAAHADDAIVAAAADADRPVWVATSDRDLRQRLGDSVDRLIGGGAFLRSL